MGSLRDKSHRDRSEPKLSCSGLTEKSQKGGLGDRLRGLSRNKLPLPIALLVACLMGTCRVQDRKVKQQP